MKKVFLALACVSFVLTGCTTLLTSRDYMPVVDHGEVYVGDGGIAVEKDGIEIWTQGSPERRFKVIGTLKVELNDGLFADSLLRSAIVAEVKAHHGDAVILNSHDVHYAGNYTVNNATMNYSGTYSTYGNSGSYRGTGYGYGNGFSFAMNQISNVYLVIQYLD